MGKGLQVSEAAYRKDLAAIRSGDDQFADLEACGFVTVPCSDLEGRLVILVTPQRLPPGAASTDIERLYKFVIQKLDSVVTGPFCVVYVHSGAEEWATRPTGLALRALYERCAAYFILCRPSMALGQEVIFTTPCASPPGVPCGSC